MTNNKEFREKFNTIMNGEGNSSRKILEVLDLADEYEIDEFDLDEEFEYYEASKKVASGECLTINEAIEVLNNEEQASLKRIIESVESRKSSK